MKKKISSFLLCFIVASCAGQEETSPTATEEDTSSPSAVEEETKENSQVNEEDHDDHDEDGHDDHDKEETPATVVVYNKGEIIDVTGAGSEFYKREVNINGVRIVAAGNVGGQQAVPDAFLEKVARMVELFTDPNGEGIDAASQINFIKTLNGAPGTYHAGVPTLQRVARGGGDDYSSNFLRSPESFEQLYLSQVRSKANSQRAALLPLCELYEVTNNINLEDKKSSFTEEAVRDIDINRFCDIVDGNLDCPENKLFTPQNVSTCDASIVDPSMTRYELIDQFFAQSIYNPRWMRSSTGTRYVNGR